MKITIAKTGDDAFDLTFGDTKVTLTSGDIKILLLQATKVLIPSGGAASAAKPEDRAKKFAQRFKGANNLGVQNFIREADPDDLLVLLKAVEADKALLECFYSNMSERLRKMISEDLAFKFKDGVTSDKVDAAVNKLMLKSRELEKKGALIFEGEDA